MATTTNLSSLKINYLTQEQYDTALAGGNINDNEIYMTPSSGSGDIDVNDMTEQEVDEFVENLNTHGKSSEYRKLLWTNASSTSAFAAQTISLDLSGYDEVEIISKSYVSQATYFITKGMVNSDGVIYSQTGYGNPVRIYGTQRAFTATSTGITFSGGLDFAAAADNNYCIPYKIYGIKYERVNPPQVEIADCVIEQGTSDIWTYRKWNSGIAECWGISAQRTVTSWPTWGYINYGDPYTTYDTYPTGLFISTPVCEAQLCGASADCWLVKGVVSNTATAANTPCFYLARGTAATGTVTYTIAYHAIGRWK